MCPALEKTARRRLFGRAAHQATAEVLRRIYEPTDPSGRNEADGPLVRQWSKPRSEWTSEQKTQWATYDGALAYARKATIRKTSDVRILSPTQRNCTETEWDEDTHWQRADIPIAECSANHEDELLNRMRTERLTTQLWTLSCECAATFADDVALRFWELDPRYIRHIMVHS